MKFVCTSDTHLLRPEMPEGDVMLHAGDMTLDGTLYQLRAVCRWLKNLPHKYKVVIAGNHDFCLNNKDREESEQELADAGAIYLRDKLLMIDNINIWGSPWSLRWYDWAFQGNEEELESYLAAIPEGTDIVMTHGSPYGILDKTSRGDLVGSKAIAARIAELKPKLHLFGHIHESYGVLKIDETTYINASYASYDRDDTDPIIFEI